MARPEPRRGFETPREVLDFFGDKRLRPAFSWRDVWGEEHAYAFTVAKATELELLTLFKRSIGTALANGQGIETWKQGLLPELARIGWGGPRLVADPTGQLPNRAVDITSPRRLGTIFDSNVASARSAGQWERAQRTKAALPYILYVRTASSEPRREHLGWVGVILPIDDDWWKTHWPPNGWGCKCTIRQISAREAERLLGREPGDGGVVYRATAPDDGPPRIFANDRRGGEVTAVPAGIDPGWQTNPGLSRVRTLVARLGEQLEQAGEDDARAAIAALWASPTPRVIVGLPERERIQVPAAIAPKVTAAFGVPGRLVTVSQDTLRAKTTIARARPTELSTFGEAQSLLDAGEIVDRDQPNRRTVLTEREDGWWSTTVARSAAGFVRVLSVHRIDAWRALKILATKNASERT